MPDLLSFGPFFVIRLPALIQQWGQRQFGPPSSAIIPAYVYHAYDVTHSLVMWSFICVLLWKILKRIPRVIFAWGLHILCDIPLHDLRFFPTPYLWPFSTPFVDGMPWGRGWFMLVNYASIAITYVILAQTRKGISQTTG